MDFLAVPYASFNLLTNIKQMLNPHILFPPPQVMEEVSYRISNLESLEQ